MKNKLIALIMVGLTSISYGAPIGPSELDKEISPLSKPDIANAKMAIKNLTELAGKQSGAEKVRTERLMKTIKNLFTAEFQVGEKMKASEKAEVEATRNERNAEDWLVPNALGYVNEVASRASLVKAKEIRDRAKQQLDESQRNLLLQFQEADSVLEDFYKNQDFGVVLRLAETVSIINNRSMPENAFKPSFPQSAIATIKEFVQSRNNWILTAKNAEESGNFEEAIRFYSKARDLESKKRCSLLLAQKFESGKLYGSAIDYYEMAGDYKKAALLRSENPNLRLEAFRKLSAEDLAEKIAPSCALILNGDKAGSGFFFKKGGYILTNKHVVSDNGKITVKLDDGRSFDGQLLAKSDFDLAIVKISIEEHDFINFRVVEDVKIGLSVHLLGYPLGVPPATMNSGRISNTNRMVGGNPVYQLDVTANHGNSGGPIVDEYGHLVGILTFGSDDPNIDRFNFAITNKVAFDFVRKSIPE